MCIRDRVDTNNNVGYNGNETDSKTNPSNLLENGPYIRNGKPYGRPTLRGDMKLQFESKVYNNCVDLNGVLRDPNTNDIIEWKPGRPRKNTVDFGHKTGKTYREMFRLYKNGEITLDDLKKFQFDPENFRLETPSGNRSHKFE